MRVSIFWGVDLSWNAPDGKFKCHEHATSVSHKACGLCQSFEFTVCHTPEFMMFLLKAHIRLLIQHVTCVWNTGNEEVIQRLECVGTRHIDNLQTMTQEERLREQNLYSVQGRLLRADLFTQPLQSSNKGQRHKIPVPQASLDVRKQCFRTTVLLSGAARLILLQLQRT